MASLRKGSIAASLFWLSAGWLVLALVATGFLLTDLYSRALDTSLSETLDFHVESLTGSLLETDDPTSDAIALTDPRFNRPRSGWYWAIRDADGTLYNLSTSVVGIDLPVLMGPADSRGRRTAIMEDVFGTQMRVVERTVTVAPTTYQIVVTGNLSEIRELVGEFRGQTLGRAANGPVGPITIRSFNASSLQARSTSCPTGPMSPALLRPSRRCGPRPR